MKVLVGSNAARFWIPEFRIGKDIDWWSTEAETDKEKYSLKQMWNTYKLYASDNTYEQGYEDGYHDIHGRYDD